MNYVYLTNDQIEMRKLLISKIMDSIKDVGYAVVDQREAHEHRLHLELRTLCVKFKWVRAQTQQYIYMGETDEKIVEAVNHTYEVETKRLNEALKWEKDK